MYNPSLREEPRNKPASVVTSKQQASILNWLESTGRLIAREAVPSVYGDDTEELNELMLGDDASYLDDEEDDDDDDDVVSDDDDIV
ncbi:DUF3134 domain-containing protein [Tumidithrix elongata RA019]|uniref:DUF3134 domain-containing protein n=1 Tax=Tumidithrix elongata BACA0141 TaxID=2716417 RepID=A0AAW9PT26_9CYAN|nr:DUF3134 domain-containing protein [Tumidithrix elongata RA019]